MTTSSEPPAAATDGPSAGSPPPAKTGPTLWGIVKVLGKIGLVLAVLAGLAFAWAVFQFQRAYPEPRGVPAPVAWTTRDVILSAATPVVAGRLTVEGSTIPVTGRVGVNAAVPSFAGEPVGGNATAPATSLTPADAIVGPAVRLTATLQGNPQTCVAPCELVVPANLGCSNGPCGTTIEVRLELVGESAATGRVVMLQLAGGLTAQLDSKMPTNLRVNLVLDATSVPSPS